MLEKTFEEMYHALIEDAKWETLQKLKMMKNDILPLRV